MKDKVAYN